MFARFVTVQFQPDKIAEAGRIMENVAATLRGYAGFHEATLLADESTGHGHIMTLWQTQEDMQASETSVYQQAMQRLAATFADPPQREQLSVIMHTHIGTD
jgi:heme-degrading monooxygenase HmoA